MTRPPAEFRPSTPADGAAIAALCRRVLSVPDGSPMFTAEHMQWKYWDAWPGWSGSRSFVLTRDDRLIAHGAVVPLAFTREGCEHRLVALFDWASEPDAIGSGAALLKRIAGLADGMIMVGGSAMTRRMVGPLGFRRLGEVTRHACASTPPAPAGWTSTRVDSPPPFLPGSTRERILFHRPALRHLLRCPVAATEYHEVSRGGVTAGSFLLSFTPAQAKIADLWCASSELDHWIAIASVARKAGARPGVDEVACLASEPLQREALARAGFLACGSDPLFALAPPELVPDGATMRVQMLEGDYAFLHHGVPLPWLPHRSP